MTTLRHTPCSLAMLTGLLWCFAGSVWAAPPVILEEGIGKYPIGLHLDTLEDKEGKWTIEDVSSEKFEVRWIPSESVNPNFQITKSAYWFRFSLEVPKNFTPKLLVEISWPLLDDITFYQQTDNGMSKKRSGDKFKFSVREFPHRNFLFPIDLFSDSLSTYYFRIQSEEVMLVPITLWEREIFFLFDRNIQYGLGFFYGIMFIMCVYNLFLYFSVRDTSYLSYVCWLSATSVMFMSLDGTANEYLWPEAPFWGNISLPVMVYVAVLFLILFSRSLLETKRITPRIDKIAVGFGWYSILGGISCTFAILVFPISRAVLGYFSYSVTPVIFLLIFAGVLGCKKRMTAAFYYIFAFAFYFMGVLLFVLASFNFIPLTFFTKYGVQFGLVLQAAFLSFALGAKIGDLKKAREKALNQQLIESQKNQELTKTFEKFVPKQFLRRLSDTGIENIELGNAQTETITILFSDIRSFTTISETMTPQELLNFLNAYFKRMSRLIHVNHGFIDKFIGDAIMALFDMPDKSNEEEATFAIKAAIDMQLELIKYNRDRKRAGYVPIEIGIGIHTGEVIIGTVGAEDRMDSTVLGDNVNLAARLEDLTKPYGCPILVSSTTLNLIKKSEQILHREIDLVTVKGKTEPVNIFEVFNADPPELQELKKKSARWLINGLAERQNQNWDNAIESFQKALDIVPGDPVAIRHIGTIMKLRNEPLPDDWDGVIQLDQK